MILFEDSKGNLIQGNNGVDVGAIAMRSCHEAERLDSSLNTACVKWDFIIKEQDGNQWMDNY